MPRIHEMIESKFMKKEDAGAGILVTIAGVEKRDVGTESEPEQKWVLLVQDHRPLVLNSTNLALLEKSFGSDNSDDWIGKAVVLYNDENVSFGGKLTGGIRVDVNRTKRYHAKGDPDARGGTTKTVIADMPLPKKKAAFDDFESDPPF